MSYLVCLFIICLVLALVWVASSPSPYFGAAGLVLAAVVGCCVLVVYGYSFVSLVLFLIYLGGMLVVFVYTVSLAADPYPEAMGGRIGLHFFGYLFLLISVGVMVIVEWGLFDVDFNVNTLCDSSLVGGDFLGVSLLYSWGGFDLLICGWVLLLVLFVVLELTCGLFRGGLRSL